MKNAPPQLSIVILCYRSDKSIIAFTEKVLSLSLKLTKNLEIILVGNYIEGTYDETKPILEKIARDNPIFKTICKPKQGMMGWDMKEGLDLAKGNYICVIDGDSQFPAHNILDCYHFITTKDYGMVKTYRQHREDGLYRKLISKVYNFLFSILFPGVKSKDVNSKPKIFKREVLEKMELISDDWFIDAEIMINIEKLNVPYFEFPTVFHELKGRKSFIKFTSILEFIYNLIIFKLREWK